MGRFWLFAVLFALVLTGPLAAAGWKGEVDALLADAGAAPDEASLTKALEGNPSWADLVAHLKTPRFPPAEKPGSLILKTLHGKDGIDRPWVLFVPATYDPASPAPLLVELHGGVSQKDIADDPLREAEESPWLDEAGRNGYLILFPFGQLGATWWDDVGMDNVRRQIRLVKTAYNIDDDRVAVAGFSDGASAAFLYAMVAPDDFAAYVALNGHMGVGSLDGNLQTYVRNLVNRPGYAVTTDQDPLYGTALMRPTLALAREAGADLVCRELPGSHEFDYAATELPRIFDFLVHHPRNAHPSRLFWEAGDPQFGRCQWLVIDEILPSAAEPWHRDDNAILLDDRVSIGFIPEPASHGIGVGKVMPDSYGKTLGLTASDVVVQANGIGIETMADLDRAKAAVKRGDPFPIVVRRGSETVTLEGKLPVPQPYFLFKRSVPSAAALATLTGNRIEVRASRLGTMRILVDPDLVRLEEPLVIEVNGKTVFEGKVTPDPRFILRNFLSNRDRRQIYVAEVVARLHP